MSAARHAHISMYMRARRRGRIIACVDIAAAAANMPAGNKLAGKRISSGRSGVIVAVMKVTCGACWGALGVEAWLADNAARCPKCSELIRIPPADSPAGANAVVLTEEEATDLLKRRATSGQAASAAGKSASRRGVDAAVESPTGQGTSRGPKTEPLPAFLKRAMADIHEEPVKPKTKPLHLPRPVGRPSPITDLPSRRVSSGRMSQAAQAASEFADEVDRAESRKTFITPLVPVALVLGLVIGTILGYVLSRPASTSGEKLIAPPQSAAPPRRAVESPARPATARTPPPEVPHPVDPRSEWLAEQPNSVKLEIADATVASIRVAAVIDETPAAKYLRFPAPLGQVYLEARATLKLVGEKPVMLNLGGPKSNCWLVARDGRVLNSLGRVPNDGPTTAPDFPADASARITLDAEHPQAEVSLLFLTPARLPETRLQFTASRFADLGSDLREPDPVVSGRSLAGRWESIPDHDSPQFGADEPILAALTDAEGRHILVIEREADHFGVRIEGTDASGSLTQHGDDPAVFDATFSSHGAVVNMAVRVFDGGRKLLVYSGGGQSAAVACRRSK
jgi:hypothetical protein